MVQKVHIEIYVLISLMVFVVGFLTRYYYWESNVTTNYSWTFFENFMTERPNTTAAWGIFSFLLVVSAHLAVLYYVSKEKSYTIITRRIFIGITAYMNVLFFMQWIYMIIHEDFEFRFRFSEYEPLFDMTITVSHGYGFAFFWFLVTLPMILAVSLLHKGVTGKRYSTLIEYFKKD